METKHTPGPWVVRQGANDGALRLWELWYEPGDGLRSMVCQFYNSTICDEHGGFALDNAQFTQRAVNSHASLTAALDQCVEALERMLRVYCDYECNSPSHTQARAALETAKKVRG